MTLWNDTQIDFVAEAPNGDATLFMVEERPWGTDPDQRQQLLKKINAYHRYVDGGQLYSDHPDFVGRPVVVRLEYASEPPAEIREVIDAATRAYAAQNLAFVAVLNPALQAGH